MQYRILSVLCLWSQLAACGSTVVPIREPSKECEIQDVSLNVIASPEINPTENGETRPVVLRVYQLINDVSLQNAAFDRIWKEDDKVLGADLLKKDELFIYPSTRTDVKFERIKEANMIGAVGLFQTPAGKSWFTVFELPPPPGVGDCGKKCEGEGECGPPELNLEFSVWVDSNRMDEGSGHLEDVAESHRIRVVHLSKPGAGASPAPSAASPGTN